MNIYSLLSSIITLGVVLTSCQKEESVIQGEKILTAITISTSDNSEEGNSKSSICDDGVFSWNSGDKLHVYNGTNDGAEFSHIGVGGKRASFIGELTISNHPSGLCVIYPYSSENKFSISNILGDIPERYIPYHQIQVHEYDANGNLEPVSVGKYAYMGGKTDDSWVNESSVNLTMKHLMSFIYFDIADLPNDTDISYLKLTTSGSEFSTNARVFFKDKGVTTLYNLGNSSKTFTAELRKSSDKTLGVTPPSVGLFKVRLAIYPQVIASGTKWTIELLDDMRNTVYSHIKTFKKPSEYSVGKYCTVDINFKEEQF